MLLFSISMHNMESNSCYLVFKVVLDRNVCYLEVLLTNIKYYLTFKKKCTATFATRRAFLLRFPNEI